MLADVKPAGPRDASNLAIDRADVRQVTGADRLNDDVELAGGEHRQIVHRSFDCFQLQSPLCRNFAIELELCSADINDRDDRARRGI